MFTSLGVVKIPTPASLEFDTHSNLNLRLVLTISPLLAMGPVSLDMRAYIPAPAHNTLVWIALLQCYKRRNQLTYNIYSEVMAIL